MYIATNRSILVVSIAKNHCHVATLVQRFVINLDNAINLKNNSCKMGAVKDVTNQEKSANIDV